MLGFPKGERERREGLVLESTKETETAYLISFDQ